MRMSSCALFSGESKVKFRVWHVIHRQCVTVMTIFLSPEDVSCFSILLVLFYLHSFMILGFAVWHREIHNVYFPNFVSG